MLPRFYGENRGVFNIMSTRYTPISYLMPAAQVKAAEIASSQAGFGGYYY